MIRVLLLFCLFGGGLLTAKTLYSLADLEVLAQDGSYLEFFEHALDVRPTERQESWKAMVGKMADTYAKEILAKNEISPKDFQKIEDLYSYPSLRTDDVFRLRRQEVGSKFLKKCLQKEDPCWNELRAFWEKDKSDPEVAMKLAEMTMNHEDSPIPTWTFLDVALKSPLSEFYCKKEFVMTALWGKIEIDYVRLGPKGDLMKKIDQTIHPDCMPSLLKEARARLYHPPKVFDREVAYQVLSSQSKVTQEIQDFFYTVYLLDNPSQGELFNYSWNRVKELARTSPRREAVLRKMRELDPLPDAILSSLDQAKKRVILKHFKTYFPEYLDHYTNQCVEFYGGKGSFPAGNPTIHCQEFMKSDLAHEIIDDFKIKKFEQVFQI